MTSKPASLQVSIKLMTVREHWTAEISVYVLHVPAEALPQTQWQSAELSFWIQI